MSRYSWGSNCRKNCIALTVDEFREVVAKLYEKPVCVDFDADGLYIGFTDDEGTDLPVEDLHRRLAEKFDVEEVTSVHIDDFEPPLVWIVYKDSRITLLDGEAGLAKLCTRAVNSFSFKCRSFCKAMSLEHRTLQQSFTRLCIEWLRFCADLEDWQIDPRNEASVRVSRIVKDALEEAEIGNLPRV